MIGLIQYSTFDIRYSTLDIGHWTENHPAFFSYSYSFLLPLSLIRHSTFVIRHSTIDSCHAEAEGSKCDSINRNLSLELRYSTLDIGHSTENHLAFFSYSYSYSYSFLLPLSLIRHLTFVIRQSIAVTLRPKDRSTTGFIGI